MFSILYLGVENIHFNWFHDNLKLPINTYLKTVGLCHFHFKIIYHLFQCSYVFCFYISVKIYIVSFQIYTAKLQNTAHVKIVTILLCITREMMHV
jgi:hypothetical protein